MSTRPRISGLLLAIAAVAQIALAFVFYNSAGRDWLCNLGWALLGLSSLFGWLPMWTLRRWGEVPTGKSYTSTVRVVDRGVYAIVRHPQYLAGILLGVAFGLISQHWAVILLGAVVAGLSYADMFEEDRALLRQFGSEYSAYMARVPRANALAGILRLLARQWRKSEP